MFVAFGDFIINSAQLKGVDISPFLLAQPTELLVTYIIVFVLVQVLKHQVNIRSGHLNLHVLYLLYEVVLRNLPSLHTYLLLKHCEYILNVKESESRSHGYKFFLDLDPDEFKQAIQVNLGLVLVLEFLQIFL